MVSFFSSGKTPYFRNYDLVILGTCYHQSMATVKLHDVGSAEDRFIVNYLQQFVVQPRSGVFMCTCACALREKSRKIF